GDDEGVADDLRDVLDLHQRAALEADLGQEAAVGGVELGGLVRRVVVEDRRRGAGAAAADERPAGEERAGCEGRAGGAGEQHQPYRTGVPLEERPAATAALVGAPSGHERLSAGTSLPYSRKLA